MAKLLSIGLDDAIDSTIDSTVIIPSFLTATNGTPGSGQFRSDIQNRASIPDLANMLSVQMGLQRTIVQEIYQIQNEFGPAGQLVSGLINDKFNQVRFVGDYVSATNVRGQQVYSFSGSSTAYMEVVFYGTGFNMLLDIGNSTVAYSIDGSAESTIVIPSNIATNVNGGRNYSPNNILNLVSGLSFGLHTIKVRLSVGTGNTNFSGFEVLTETSTIQVLPGTIAKGKRKNTLASLTSVAYDSTFESGTVGTKGGCVLVYLKQDGTIGKAITPTDVTPLLSTNANHINEEIVRNYYWREFGAGRADDFSSSNFSAASRAFALDDGTTMLSVVGGNDTASVGALALSPDGSAMIFTFIGTGIDFIRKDQANGGTDTYNFSIDGGATNALVSTGSTALTLVKCASGLPYGTHTLRINRVTAGTFSLGVTQFIVYAPKKPSLPSGAIELAQYYRMADYVASTSAAPCFTATGVVRKALTQRECTFVGTWTTPGLGSIGQFDAAYNSSSTTTGAYAEYRFFGTGFEWKGYATTVTATNQTITVDGSSNLSGFTTSFLQEASAISFTASTGVISGTSPSNQRIRIQVSGLALGFHTVRVTSNNANSNYVDSLDVICPIHAPVSNGPIVVGNTLTLGNNNFIDLRKFNKKDIIRAGAANIAKTIMTNNLALQSVTSTSYIPTGLNGSVTHLNTTGRIRVSFKVRAYGTLNNSPFYSIYINGVLTGYETTLDLLVGGSYHVTTDSQTFEVNKGINKIDIFARSATGTAVNINSINVTVEEI